MAERNLSKERRRWLPNERGLNSKTIKYFQLGWNPKERWDTREFWALEPQLNKNGNKKKVWLPEGLVIPSFSDGKLLRLRIRLTNPREGPKYCLIPGSSSESLCLGSTQEKFVIVESELDAMLLYQEAGNLLGIVSLGSAQMRPDARTTEVLESAKKILIALDSDEAGAKAAWTWWRRHFPNSQRWPVIRGKDPSEAYKNGLNLGDWVLASEDDNDA